MGRIKERAMQTPLMQAFLLLAALGYLLSQAIYLPTRWAIRQLRNGAVATLLTATGLTLATYHGLSPTSALAAGTAIATGLAWAGLRHPEWVRAQWRYHSHYRWRFDSAIRAADLGEYDPKKPGEKPAIVGVTANEHVDIVEVEMAGNQTPDSYQLKIQGIRRKLGFVGGRAVNSKAGVHRVTLWLWKTDPLAQIVQPYPHRPPPEDGDWDAWFKQGLQIGRLENGDPFSLDLLTVPFHHLIAGASRSGKSGFIGAIIGVGEWALKKKAWLIDAIDPAMGMELEPYYRAGLFHRFTHAEAPQHIKNLSLEDLYERHGDDWMLELGEDFHVKVAEVVHRFYMEMRHRGAQLFGVARVFTVSEKTPLRTLVVDEIASVMALPPAEIRLDNGAVVKVNIKWEMEEILRQGLKCGFMVLGAVQDPLKSQVDVRDLFTYFTCFGGVGQVGFDKMFGTHAYTNAGEPKIPKRLQGVAMTGTSVLSLEQIALLADEYDQTVRIRVSWENDAAIAAMRDPDPTDLPTKEAVLV